MANKNIEPGLLGFLPDSPSTGRFWVMDANGVKRPVFSSDGKLYTEDGASVQGRLETLEAGIPPLDDARIVALEGDKAAKDITVADHEDRIAAAESDIDTLQATVASEALELNQAKTDIVNIQQSIAEIPQGLKGDPGDPGTPGAPGDPGPAGPGVPIGGTAGDILRKKSNDNYDTEWGNHEDFTAYAAAVAGGYTGNESAFQTDLASISGLAAAIDAIVGV